MKGFAGGTSRMTIGVLTPEPAAQDMKRCPCILDLHCIPFLLQFQHLAAPSCRSYGCATCSQCEAAMLLQVLQHSKVRICEQPPAVAWAHGRPPE